MSALIAAAVVGATVAVVGTVHTIEQTKKAERAEERTKKAAAATKAAAIKKANDRSGRIEDSKSTLNPTGALGDTRGLGVFAGPKRDS